MAEITLRWLRAPDGLSGPFGVRRAVFMDEQGFRNEFDGIDDTAWHLELTVDGRAAGCLRIYPGDGGAWHIGRVAVLKEYRALHLGRRMMEAALDKIKAMGGRKAVLSAQCQAAPFYRKCGFAAVSEPYLDEHCPHLDMEYPILPERKDRVTTEYFGALSDGRKVTKYTIGNGILSMSVLDLGGIIQSLRVPGPGGEPVDVVLGYDTAEGCEAFRGNYFGALIGRFGNRIGEGKFTLNGKEYALYKNDGPNHLHGGKDGFNWKSWTVAPEGEHGLRLTLHSPDGEEGYPGDLDVTVVYRLEGSALSIEYEAVSDADTVINLTNHAYFNLSGEGEGTIENHILTLRADAFTAIDANGLTVEKVVPVAGTPFDFRSPKAIGRDIGADDAQLLNGGGYDHNFVLDPSGSLKEIAEAVSPVTGIRMKVLTTQPGVQLYTGNAITTPQAGKNGHTYGRRSGFCLETQHFPNGMACPSFISPVLKAGDVYRQKTVYAFSLDG